MWDYAMLSKIAKRLGGPVGLVITIAAGGVVVGSAGTVLVQKLRHGKETNKHEPIADRKVITELSDDTEADAV